MNELLLTKSKVVTPNSLLGLKTPCFLKTSATIATVEFTGFEITNILAFGQYLAQFSAIFEIIPPFKLNKSSLVIPGFLGTPAGMITKSALDKAPSNPFSSARYPATLAPVSMWFKSAEIPGV
ncbi:hypothetical protein WICMUC_001601 [Wickerhamomyces mucosus]|uniref:Uncharacterized protein n=1 Tax=Wickerhamomyces mucosus TaxID=1378264 RepID=A0A9P8TH07_9ASCO|nr:hypothetical protein WICMUC_001601 [Wickerhamomyces mucosus]